MLPHPTLPLTHSQSQPSLPASHSSCFCGEGGGGERAGRGCPRRANHLLPSPSPVRANLKKKEKKKESWKEKRHFRGSDWKTRVGREGVGKRHYFFKFSISRNTDRQCAFLGVCLKLDSLPRAAFLYLEVKWSPEFSELNKIHCGQLESAAAGLAFLAVQKHFRRQAYSYQLLRPAPPLRTARKGV